VPYALICGGASAIGHVVLDTTPAVIPSRLLYPPSEVETLLGISHATLYRLLRAGRLDAVKIGSVTRVTHASIERLLSNSPAAGGASPQAEPPAGADMGPNPHGRGPWLRRARARSPRHRRDRADEVAGAASSG
jgi:excisionase family DNA binding protein